MDAIALLKDAWPQFVVAGPGVFAVYKLWQSNRKLVQRERSDLIKIAQDAAASVIEHLRQEADDLRQRVDDLEGELDKLRKEHHEMMISKDAQIALLEGEKRQLESKLQSYEQLLIRHGIPLPIQGQPYWKIEDGTLKPAAEASP